MDRPEVDTHLLEEDLRNLRIINRLFGGLSAVRRHLPGLFRKIPVSEEIRILDLATGSADHPVSIARLARRIGRKVRIIGVDRNPTMVEISRRRTATFPEIEILEGDIRGLQAPEWKSHIALCSLAIHHLSVPEAVQLLRDMYRLSSVGLIVNDLNRNAAAAWIASVYARLTSGNPLTLHDTPASILRSFTPSELAAMAKEAGLTNVRVFREPVFRLVLLSER
jgi:ubiquinone/menaquinone biosynthesis C-methylase UbiE